MFTKLLSGSLLRAISQNEHEQYGRHDFGNNLRLCLSLSTQKLNWPFFPLHLSVMLIQDVRIVLSMTSAIREGDSTVF